jgi:hypothetical protein
LWSSSLPNFPHDPISSFLLYSNLLLSIMITIIFNLRSSLT